MTSSLSIFFKKYSVPSILLIVGITMLVLGLQTDQNSMYNVATAMMLAAGVLTLLFSAGTLSVKSLTLLGLVAGISSALAMYLSFKSVYDTHKHIAKYELCVKLAQNNLSDIRSAQKAFADMNGRYAKDWDELIDFINNGKVPFVDAFGVVPSRKITEQERNFLYGDNRAIDNNMTELEAYRLSKMANAPEDLQNFKRDTILVSFLSTKFGSKSYKAGRMKEGFGAFSAEKLPIIPFSNGKKWKMETRDSIQIGTEYFPAIRVSGMLPIAKLEGEKPKEIYFGQLTSNDTGGSWEE